jgi:predicted AlkP superfamily pyrophosphatase or phosphodiesterase
MPRRLLALVALIAVIAAPAGSGRLLAESPAAPASPPRLILLVVVDQCRADYLTRFERDYTAGFRRLLDKGAVFSKAFFEHYPTVTAVGHATTLSGAIPSASGIVGNDWFDRTRGVQVTAVSDDDTKIVGGREGAGSSPRRLLVDTLGDQVKTAAPAAAASEVAPRVVGVSLKDRAAILMVGHKADVALWYDSNTGRFVTSTYYGEALPPWAEAYNATKPSDALAGKDWTFLDPAERGGYRMPAQPGPQLYNSLTVSPFGNDLVVGLAEAALVGERLGQRGVTDLLAVSFSSNDSVGHQWGPDSREVRDISVRTDRVVGRLLERVDALVGLDRTVVVFTGDHGVAPLPEHRIKQGLPAGRMSRNDLFGPIVAALAEKFGPGNWLLATAGSSPYLNHALIAERKLDPAEVRKVAAKAASGVLHVSRVYTREQILNGEVPDDQIGRRVVRGHHPERSGDLEIILEPYWIRASSGTTHGSPYDYDAHVPLIFMGPGVKPGRYDGQVAINDLAPTLAKLTGLRAPKASAGRVLGEIVAGPAAPTPTGGVEAR